MLKERIVLLILMVCLGWMGKAQTTRTFQAPSNASGNCFNYDYTCGCSSGWCSGCHHAGKDYCGASTDDIVATGSGRIAYVSNACDGQMGAGDNRGFGRTVIIAHKMPGGANLYSLYAHLSSISTNIVAGKYITKGYFIGKKGSSGGGSNGVVHLHFEMKNHSGLGHDPDCQGPGCIGYVKSSLLPVSSRGYYDPNSYISVQDYFDIVLDSNLPSTLSTSNVSVNLNFNSPFSDNCLVDMRLALYNSSNVFVEEISSFLNKTLTSGSNNMTFSKASLTSSPGTYKIRVDYKIPGSNTWVALPTWSTYVNPKAITLTAPASCGNTTLTTGSGAFSDGSGPNNYTSNLNCSWLIQPAGATSITLSFASFATELGFDFVKVYSGSTTSAPLAASYSGFNIPATMSIPSPVVLVTFSSDASNNYQGWSASYTSTGLVNNGIYKLTRQGTNKVMDAYVCGGAGTNVQLWDDLNNNCQRWLFQLQSDGSFEIKRKNTTLNLDAQDCGSWAGTNVRLWDDNSLPCQRWIVTLQSDGSYELMRQGTASLNLDAQDCGNWAGANVQLYSDNNTSCQRWLLTLMGNNAGDSGGDRDDTQTQASSSTNFSLDPNPTNGQVRLLFKDNLPEGKATVQAFDLVGRMLETIFSGSTTQLAGGLEYDTSHLPAGTYILIFSSESGRATQRLQVVH